MVMNLNLFLHKFVPERSISDHLYRCAMSQKLTIGSFKRIEHTSQFNKHFIENYNEDSDGGYFLRVDV